MPANLPADVRAAQSGELQRRATARGGVFTARDAERCGFTRARRRTLLASGAWRELRRGVYADGAVVEFCREDPVRWHCLITAAALAARPAAVASEHSAAALHRLDLLGPLPSSPTLTRAPQPGQGSTRLTTVHVLAATTPATHIVDVYGLAATDVSRTVIDVLRKCSFRAGVVLADSALRQVSAAQLHGNLRDCRNWPGSAQVGCVLAFADGRSESVLESLGRVTIAAQDLPPPQLQQWVGEHGPEYRVDYLFEGWRTVGEADGAVKYRTRDDLLREKRREDRLRDLGFEVVRFVRADVSGDGAELAARFRAAFRRSGPGIGRTFPAPQWWYPGQHGPAEPAWPAALADVPWWLRDATDLRLWQDGDELAG